MPTTTIQQDIEVLKQLKVTDWEKTFLSSIEGGIAKYGKLTDKQQNVFDRIAEKYLDENGSPKTFAPPPTQTKTKTWTAAQASSSGEKKPSEIPPTWYLKKVIEKLSGELKADAEALLAKITPVEKEAARVKNMVETKFNMDPAKVGASELSFDETIPF